MRISVRNLPQTAEWARSAHLGDRKLGRLGPGLLAGKIQVHPSTPCQWQPSTWGRARQTDGIWACAGSCPGWVGSLASRGSCWGVAPVEEIPVTEQNLGSAFLELWAGRFCLQMSVPCTELCQLALSPPLLGLGLVCFRGAANRSPHIPSLWLMERKQRGWTPGRGPMGCVVASPMESLGTAPPKGPSGSAHSFYSTSKRPAVTPL